MSEAPIVKRRGRPPRKLSADVFRAEQIEPQELEQLSKRTEETRRARRRRSESGPTAGMKLHVPDEYKEKGYEYRWINDDAALDEKGSVTGQRMHAKTVLDDWDQVMSRSGIEGQGEGTPVKRFAGRGEGGRPIYAYLCRKPKDWYDADKAKEQSAIDKREESMRRGVAQGPEGLTGSTTYIPESGIRIARGR